ncbi:hypothetical protein IC615_03175 [Serratia ureilytica]
MFNVGAEFLGFILIKSINRFTGAFIHIAAHAGISGSVGKQTVKIGNAFLVTLRINIFNELTRCWQSAIRCSSDLSLGLFCEIFFTEFRFVLLPPTQPDSDMTDSKNIAETTVRRPPQALIIVIIPFIIL